MFRSTLQTYEELTVGVRRVVQGAGNYDFLSLSDLIYPFSNYVFNKDISYISARLFNYFPLWHDGRQVERNADVILQL
jgi:hypothetical protein